MLKYQLHFLFKLWRVIGWLGDKVHSGFSQAGSMYLLFSQILRVNFLTWSSNFSMVELSIPKPRMLNPFSTMLDVSF
jgi:hypothetical protein